MWHGFLMDTQLLSLYNFMSPWSNIALNIFTVLLWNSLWLQYCAFFSKLLGLIETGRGRPRWYQTLHRLAPPLYGKEKENKKERKNTCDTWHQTPDTWHLIPDAWYVTHGGGWTFSKNVCSLPLAVWVSWCFEGLEEKDEWLNQKMNHICVCRTSPATPGVLII